MKNSKLFKEAFKAGYKKALRESAEVNPNSIKKMMYEHLLYELDDNIGDRDGVRGRKSYLDSIATRLAEDLKSTIKRAVDDAVSGTLDDIAEEVFDFSSVGGNDELEEKCYDVLYSVYKNGDFKELEDRVFDEIVKKMKIS